mmetsp:Transcript_1931/g.1843  ORF Transcript_1931/g.1843 Transcript_1931/m.1843 type:complete len:271 (-) Transcript_1931:1061-1873(-)
MSSTKPKPKGKPPKSKKPKQNEPKKPGTARDSKPNRKGKNQRQRQHLKKQPKGKSESMIAYKPQLPLKIDPSLKKLRKVPENFVENKKNLLSKFKMVTPGEKAWTQSKGEGTDYEEFLESPLHAFSVQIPLNLVMKENKLVYKPKVMEWDTYFEAVLRNTKSGFVSKYNRNNQKFARPPSASKPIANEIYNDSKIEWDEGDEKEEEKASSKKYKIQFKEISDVEKKEIMKKISSKDIPLPLSAKEPVELTEDLRENDQFYGVEQENMLDL